MTTYKYKIGDRVQHATGEIGTIVGFTTLRAVVYHNMEENDVDIEHDDFHPWYEINWDITGIGTSSEDNIQLL